MSQRECSWAELSQMLLSLHPPTLAVPIALRGQKARSAVGAAALTSQSSCSGHGAKLLQRESKKAQGRSFGFQSLPARGPCVSLTGVSGFACFLSLKCFPTFPIPHGGWSLFCNYTYSLSMARGISVVSEHKKKTNKNLLAKWRPLCQLFSLSCVHLRS